MTSSLKSPSPSKIITSPSKKIDSPKPADPIILDNRIKSSIQNAAEKIRILKITVNNITKENEDIKKTVELANDQKTELTNKLNELQATSTKLKEDIEKLMISNHNQEKEISETRFKITSTQKDLNKTQKEYTTRIIGLWEKERKDHLRSEETKAALDDKIQKTKKDIETLQMLIKDKNRTITILENEIKNIKSHDERRVASLKDDYNALVSEMEDK